MTEETSIVGIPWYRKRDYARIVSLMADTGQLPNSYERWRYRAERLERALRAAGKTSMRALIEPKAFARWCAAHRLKANAHSRLLYVEMALRTE